MHRSPLLEQIKEEEKTNKNCACTIEYRSEKNNENYQ
jgi:hypothetical protein